MNKNNSYQQLLQDLPAAIYTCNKKGIITFYNQTAVQLWGRTPEQGIDSWNSFWKIYNKDGEVLTIARCPISIVLNKVRQINSEELIVIRPDGEQYHLLSTAQPVFDDSGNFTGAMDMLVNITKQKHEQQLFREVLEEKNRELERSNNELASFSYIASHDLQEPLRKIITFADKLLVESKFTESGNTKIYLEKIIASSERMRHLIEDVLNFSRISHEEKFIKTDLNTLLNTIVSDFDQLIFEKNATINISDLPTIPAIPLQMRQLFYNLISNALKFTNDPVPPTIDITTHPVSPEELAKYPTLNKNIFYIKILVKDNGIGFYQEFSERIFIIFQRLHSKNEYSGTGIGLALCRKITDNHKGLIYAESQEGKGATFHVVLPSKIAYPDN